MQDHSDDAKFWIWQSYRMMETAKGLHRVADEMYKSENSPDSDRILFSGKFVAVPVLMTLAMEIALKAWQCRERNGEPDRKHDLLELFESLDETTQARLQERALEYLHPTLGPMFSPDRSGLEWVLWAHREVFRRWRYSYEMRNGNFETGHFNMALTVVIGMFEESARWSSR